MNTRVSGLIVSRLLMAIPQILFVAAMVFVVLRLLPADPAAMTVPPNATHEELEAARRSMGLDRPIYTQFGIWLGQLAHWDLGRSFVFRQPVRQLLADALPGTIELVLAAAMFAGVIGVAGGLWMFRLHGRRGEAAVDALSSVLMAVPEFLWAIFFILLFGVAWPVLPFAGRLPPTMNVPSSTGFLLADTLLAGRPDAFARALQHMLLPALALALHIAALIMRVLRSSLIETYHEDYVETARLRGLSEGAILMRHAFKNAFLPTLSLMGVQFSFLFGGTLLVEVIFSYPGIGSLMVEAVRNTDLPIIQATALVYALAVLSITLAVDLCALFLNPRLRTAR